MPAGKLGELPECLVRGSGPEPSPHPAACSSQYLDVCMKAMKIEFDGPNAVRTFADVTEISEGCSTVGPEWVCRRCGGDDLSGQRQHDSLAATEELTQGIVGALNQIFPTKHLGERERYMRRKYIRDSGKDTSEISQTQFITSMLNCFDVLKASPITPTHYVDLGIQAMRRPGLMCLSVGS